MHTSKEMLAFSDFPIPDDWPTFLPHRKVSEYLELYSEEFKIKQYIRFGRLVVNIVPQLDASGLETGKWAVSSQSLLRKKSKNADPLLHRSASNSSSAPSSSWLDIDSVPFGTPPLSPKSSQGQIDSSVKHLNLNSAVKCEVFDFVIVCTGHHWKPRMPDFIGMDTFSGKILHSHAYRMPYSYKDDRVIVVGVGNSGMDIASELSQHASQVHISSRSGTWIVPKTTLFGVPTDHLSTRLGHLIPRSILNFGMESLTKLHFGDLRKYGLSARHDYLSAHPTVNEAVIGQLQSGKIQVHTNIAHINGNTVTFIDNTSIDVDVIIHCTGYLVEHPFLDHSIVGREEEGSNRVQLYKHIFPINHKNLAFVGLVQPPGSILPVAELQSRLIAKVISGQIELPSPPDMRDSVSRDWQRNCSDYIPRERHTLQVDFGYMDMLAKRIGCLPDMWNLWKSNWKLASQVTFGPLVACQYRLTGPDTWDGAAAAIDAANSSIDLKHLIPQNLRQLLNIH